MDFQRINNIAGWFVFAVALVTYWLTIEPTASYWDCGEFIAVAYKLEVSHPPGAPLFMLLGRMFSFLAFGDVTKVAYWVNFSSVLASSFTSLFLFWSITLFGRKIMKFRKLDEMPGSKTFVLVGAGLVGSLTYTFCDSAWFSAVEAEVYALSSFFTAFVVWGILKWELIEDESKANRWMILIFFMMGLSIGVHLLNLVTLPAMGLIYYFRKFRQPSLWGIVFTLAISLLLILFINEFIIPGLPTIAGHFEIFFVNTLRLPFGSGVILFGLIILAALVYGIWYSQKHNMVILNTFLLATAFILIGYSSYATIVIRSNFNPPINENDPSDVMSFVRYLRREQYGSRPLLYGQYFTARITGIKEGAPVYVKGKDRYEISDRRIEYRYDSTQQVLLPRIWSTDRSHQARYREILGLREGQQPTMWHNIKYMFQHQIGWMYMRYFMFNFSGRESDIQDAGWMSPANWFEDVPSMLKDNKARNNFFMIPFIIGLIGMFYQIGNDSRNFAVVGLLFLLTGIGLVVYLNSPPIEPRERDYIYAGSYYAYCFWIGFAVIGLADILSRFIKNMKAAGVIATLICLPAPALMAAEGWDDHDRSNRFFSVDSAINYLQSCAPNAILFTGGDNDTFPLWYSQEVEGVRTDMRVIVLSYYNTDWYISQSMRPVYESPAFPYTLSIENYKQGGPNDMLFFYDAGIKNIDLKQFLDLLKKNYKGLAHPQYQSSNMIPSRDLILKVDVEKVKSMGIVPKEMESMIVPYMLLRVQGNGLEKKDLAMLDVLATSNWERPLYVNNTSLSQFNVDLRPYVVQEGNAYRILPVFNPNQRGDELVNTNLSFENMTKKFQFRELDNPNVYYSQDYRGFVINHRSSFNSLAAAFIEAGDPAKARETLLFSLEKMPDAGLPYDYTTARTVGLLLEVGEKDKAIEISNIMIPRSDEMLTYMIEKGDIGDREFQIHAAILGELERVMLRYGETDLAKKLEDINARHEEAMKNARPARR